MRRKEKITAARSAIWAVTLMFLAVSALFAARLLFGGSSTGTTVYRVETAQRVSDPAPLPERTLVNVNTADVDELQTLSGIGPSLAQAIVDEREANGPFETLDELLRVDGIGSGKLELLREEACTGTESDEGADTNMPNESDESEEAA